MFELSRIFVCLFGIITKGQASDWALWNRAGKVHVSSRNSFGFPYQFSEISTGRKLVSNCTLQEIFPGQNDYCIFCYGKKLPFQV